MPPVAQDHAQLMDDVYRYQRLIYDLTRKYYLLGRDHLIRELGATPDAHVLEVGCGTGRNLEKIGQRYPKAALYGLDISEQMLLFGAKEAWGGRHARPRRCVRLRSGRRVRANQL